MTRTMLARAAMRTRVALALLALPAVFAVPMARAETLYESYFGKAQDGAPCYARTYDGDHLAKHPAQTVQSIEIDMDKAKVSGESNTPGSFEIGFAVRLKKGPQWYGQAGVCKTEADAFSCFLEADGGTFRLKPEGARALRLETGDAGIQIEGSNDFVTLDGTGGDDKTFILSLGRTECDEAKAFFDTGNE